jgi:hypothetical protein
MIRPKMAVFCRIRNRTGILTSRSMIAQAHYTKGRDQSEYIHNGAIRKAE